MTLTLKTNQERGKVIPLLEDSLRREMDFLSLGIAKTTNRLVMFREKYGVSNPGQVADLPPLDRVEWEGEELTLAKLTEQLEILQEIEIL